MREILFRGKRIDKGEWVFGNFIEDKWGDDNGNTVYAILQDRVAPKMVELWTPVKVIPETVGQYTGLTDKNGTKIFEGDLMAFRPLKCVVEVVWDGIGWKTFSRFLGGKIRLADATERYDIHTMRTFEVVGNKWDNPELLEVKE